tara:strand:+ start:1973 stop:2992 length:1020 start_codon:yes stop_codon:yes gene_type:complete
MQDNHRKQEYLSVTKQILKLNAVWVDPPSDLKRSDITSRLHDDVRLEFSTTPTEKPNSHFDLLIAGKMTPDILQCFPTIKGVVMPFSGLPQDLRKTLLIAPERTLKVFSVDFHSVSVAEMAVTLLLAALRGLITADRKMRNGEWWKAKTARQLNDLNILVLGLGKVGLRVAKLCNLLGMNINAVRRNSERNAPDYVHVSGPDCIHTHLQDADAVVVCLPLTDRTRGLIGAEELRIMKSDAVLVNVGRAHVVQEWALFEALKNDQIFGAAIDVWYEEERELSMTDAAPFHELDNVLMSPHRSWRMHGAEQKRAIAVADFLNRYAAGNITPDEEIDLASGY